MTYIKKPILLALALGVALAYGPSKAVAEANAQHKLEVERSRFVQATGHQLSAELTGSNGWTDLHMVVAMNAPALAEFLLDESAKADEKPLTNQLNGIHMDGPQLTVNPCSISLPLSPAALCPPTGIESA